MAKPKTNTVVSLVIPCYNEELVLSFLFQELIKLEKSINKSFGKVEYIFVNDGSQDKTAEMLNSFIKKHEGVVVHFSRNFGHQTALEAGYHYATGDAIITLDADLQDPPEVVLKMLEKFNDGYDVVLGQRNERKVDTLFKKYSALAFYKFINFMTGMNIPENVADFRLISRRVRDELLKLKEPKKYWRGLVIYVGFNRTIVKYKREKRVAGTTHYPLIKMFKFAFDAVIGLSNKIPMLIFIMFLLSYALQLTAPFFGRSLILFYVIYGLAFFLLSASVFLLTDLLVRVFRLLQGRPNYIVADLVEGKKYAGKSVM